MPGVQKVLGDVGVINDQSVVGLSAEARISPIRAAGEYLLGLAVRIAEDHELVMPEVAGGHHAVGHAYFGLQLSSNGRVLVIGRGLKGAVGQDEIAILAKR